MKTPLINLLLFCLLLLCAAAACFGQEGKRVSVTVTNFSFDPKELTVAPGTTVEWTDAGGKHTIEADNGAFKSAALTAGGKFEFKFDTPGTYDYFCGFHGSKGGHDMAGKIIVK
jgi:plastocyanin